MAKSPPTSRDNDRHCPGENQNNQTSSRVPARRTPRTGDTSGLSNHRSQHRNANDDDDDDDEVREPERQRQRLGNHDDPECCDCTRFSTCTALVGKLGAKGCACKIAKRKCHNCRCFKNKCRNKRDNLSTIRNKEGTMQTFFSTADGCGTSLKPNPPPAAAARPLATATPPASVTNDAARSRASTGAPPTHCQRTILSLLCPGWMRRKSLRILLALTGANPHHNPCQHRTNVLCPLRRLDG